MEVSYTKLREIMVKYDIQHEVMRKAIGCTTTEIAKIKKDIFFTLPTAKKIADYISRISGKPHAIEDIMDFIDG